MFDDNPPQKGTSVPQNLPVSEPEDIFAETPEAAGPMPPLPPSPPSALSAGALKPRQPAPAPQLRPAPSGLVEEISAAAESQASIPPAPRGAAGPMGYPLREPRLSRYLITIGLTLLFLAVIGGAGWFLYASFVREDTTPTPRAAEPIEEEAVEAPPEIPDENATVDNTLPPETILFGEPVDLDGDGLEASRETALGTDPNNWDTDRDGLSDYDEVVIWKTDPLNQDADGDGYKDGDEVKNGYSPSGPGKIFEPPAS